MDASVVEVKVGPLPMFMISTTDFFYPLVDDPYVQGKIACANVLSDLYAMGVTEVDTMLMILGVSLDMNDKERDVVTTLLIQGFNDLAKIAGTNVTGGQTVMNPWPIVGGVAMSVRMESQFIRPKHAIPGDVIILTKPLGTQVSVNLMEWTRNERQWKRVDGSITKEEVQIAYEQSMEMMCRLNKTAAMLMHKYGAHSATDVTGFGILGHLQNQVNSQTEAVDFILDALPVIKHMARIDQFCDQMFKLVKGYSAETSGGLLLCIPEAAASMFVNEILEMDGKPAWIIGKVVQGNRMASIVENPNIIEV